MKKIEEIRKRDSAREKLIILLMSLDTKEIENILAMIRGILGATFFIEEMSHHPISGREQREWKN